jgi:hypothetical protein
MQSISLEGGRLLIYIGRANACSYLIRFATV